MKTIDDDSQNVRQPAGISSTPSTPIEPVATHDPYLALRFRDFRFLLIGTFISVMGEQMVNVALGWELYDRTGSALILGLLGLMQVLPIFLFSLPAGHFADQFDRKRIVIITQIALALCAFGLTWLSYTHGSVLLIFGCLLLVGTAQAFNSPASSTLLPQIVPESAFQSAATWSTSSWQLASVLGPALGGLLIGVLHGATPIYALSGGATLIFTTLIFFIRVPKLKQLAREKVTIRSLMEGINFLRTTRIMLAAITLDLFAVLLGGATTLLPIFAKDVLQVGPVGLGWLRAAPSIGAVCMALAIAHLPPFKRAGKTLLLAVAAFGLATVVFGLSHSFWLSLLMLFLLGAFDNVSVVIRHTLELTLTPNEMRGRISSINTLFIAASNQLGGFESGLTAQLFSPIISVVGGGVGTVLVVLAVALLWPEMRRLGSLSETTPGS